MTAQAFLAVSVVVLALMLMLPVQRLLLTLGVRRLQSRLGRELSAHEMAQRRKSAWLTAVPLSLVFSLLFNAVRLGAGGA